MDTGECSSDPIKLMFLKLAFRAMEPSNFLISLAREAGKGSIPPQVQTFIVEECIRTTVKERITRNQRYVMNFLKKIIADVESSSMSVVDSLYEELSHYLTVREDEFHTKETNRIYREISFLSPHFQDKCGSNLIDLVARLCCSLNMLEGDTGCSLWPSSLFLSEFIISNAKIFANKFCFEVGSGVGLVGIALNHIGASKVVLTDGDMATLANMRANLELNNVCFNTAQDSMNQIAHKVECRHLSWELASESELKNYQPDIILGADVIYNPQCVLHLVRVLSVLLRGPKLNDDKRTTLEDMQNKSPIAYIATVIRNKVTFDYFLKICLEFNLLVTDITSMVEVPNLLPYMWSYNKSNVHLLRISFMSK
ncbi:hypothetical protein LUZ60_013449 [Juncus effusus]|nr:hypothetical protein LUZ60_013449 [Juncus effusus]